jgi:hypothetical protein
MPTAGIVVLAMGIGLLVIGVQKTVPVVKKVGHAITRPFHHKPKPAPKPWLRPKAN